MVNPFKVVGMSLKGKTLLWNPYLRIFADGGNPKFKYKFKICNCHVDPHWKIKEFCVTWIGRQVFFSFGKDVKGLYKNYDRRK